VLRFQDANNWYKADLNRMSLVVQKRVGGTYTTLGTAPFAAAPSVASLAGASPAAPAAMAGSVLLAAAAVLLALLVPPRHRVRRAPARVSRDG